MASRAFTNKLINACFKSGLSTSTLGTSVARRASSLTLALSKLGPLDRHDLFQNFLEAGFFLVHLRRTREIEKAFHDGIQAVNFAIQHADGLQRQSIAVGQALLQIFQPDAHGVQRIFHFVGHARGDSPELRKALGDLQLRADAFARFEVLECDERAHARSPSLITWTLTPTRRGGRIEAGEHHFGGSDRLEFAVLQQDRFAHIDDRAEKYLPRGAPEADPPACERNRSTAGLTITARPSTEKSSRPSSRPPRTWSRFSRKVLKISRTPRSCIPIWLILVLTWPNSSPRSSGFWSNSPLEMRSSCAEMRSSGASDMLLTNAASNTEISTEASASNAAERKRRRDFAAQQAGLHRDANIAERDLMARRTQLEGIGNFVGLRRAVHQTVSC